MRRAAWTLAAAVALLLLAGCAGDPEAPATTSASPPSASAEVPAGTPTGQAGEWTVEQCSTAQDEAAFTEHNCQEVLGLSDGDLTEGDGEPKPTEVPLGQPFELISEENGHPTAETMTVRGVECGIKEIPEAMQNPDWNSTDGGPTEITMVADPGMMFCGIDGTMEITGDFPMIGWTDFEYLVTEDAQSFIADEKASTATYYLNYKVGGIEQNPGTPPFDIVKIYQVPEGTIPFFLTYPSLTSDTGTVALCAVS